MSEFERAFAEACELSLREIFVNGTLASTVFHLSRGGVALKDCAERPQDFDDALSLLFLLSGAVLIEGRILRRFYRNNGLGEFEWSDGLNFCEDVRRARLAFESRKR